MIQRYTSIVVRVSPDPSPIISTFVEVSVVQRFPGGSVTHLHNNAYNNNNKNNSVKIKFGRGPVLLFSWARAIGGGGPPSSPTDRNPVTRVGRRFSGNSEGARTTASTGPPAIHQTTTVTRPSSLQLCNTRRLQQLRHPIAVATTRRPTVSAWRREGWAGLPDRRATATTACRPVVGPLESSDRPAPDRLIPPSLRPGPPLPRGIFHATRAHARTAKRLHVCPHPSHSHTPARTHTHTHTYTQPIDRVARYIISRLYVCTSPFIYNIIIMYPPPADRARADQNRKRNKTPIKPV